MNLCNFKVFRLHLGLFRIFIWEEEGGSSASYKEEFFNFSFNFDFYFNFSLCFKGSKSRVVMASGKLINEREIIVFIK